MNPSVPVRTQRGATLIVALILLLLFTLMVSSAFTLSTSNLKAVGNMQVRDEVLAAANSAIEQVLSSPFTTAPAAETIEVDIDNDGAANYTVSIATPVCIRASISSAAPPSSITLPVMASSTWNTIWDLKATVADAASGAAVLVRSGVRVLLTDAQKKAVCA